MAELVGEDPDEHVAGQPMCSESGNNPGGDGDAAAAGGGRVRLRGALHVQVDIPGVDPSPLQRGGPQRRQRHRLRGGGPAEAAAEADRDALTGPGEH